MVEGMLTQEEIDALLSGASFESPTQQKTQAQSIPPAMIQDGDLGANELKALADRLRGGFGGACEVTATLIGRKLTMTPLGIDMADDAAIETETGSNGVVFDFEMGGQAMGAAALAMSLPDASMISDIMMGGDGSAQVEMDELHQTAAKEAISSLVSGLATALSRELGMSLSAGNLNVRIDNGHEPPLAGRGNRVFARYRFEIEGLRNGTMYFVLDSSAGRAIAGTKAPVRMPTARPAGREESRASDAIRPVQFPTLTPTLTDIQSKNIDILMDVPMQVTVELGRATMMIRDVLDLGTGSIIELDKLAGEPVDLLVNQKLIARGEVVVIDESFGVRVTDIVSPIERSKLLS
ncbi:MAG: flagellar motor switch protein FliN [Candidatus Hydrogenedentota bacterium]